MSETFAKYANVAVSHSAFGVSFPSGSQSMTVPPDSLPSIAPRFAMTLPAVMVEKRAFGCSLTPTLFSKSGSMNQCGHFRKDVPLLFRCAEYESGFRMPECMQLPITEERKRQTLQRVVRPILETKTEHFFDPVPLAQARTRAVFKRTIDVLVRPEKRLGAPSA